MRIEEIKKYIADDGTEFDNEKDCIKYEATDYTEYMLGNIPHMMVIEDAITPWCGSIIYGYLFLWIETEGDKARFEEWCEGRYDAPRVIAKLCETYVVECCMSTEFSEELDDIERVCGIWTIGDFEHRVMHQTHEAEFYVKNMFKRGNAK